MPNKHALVAGEIATNSESFENLATLCDRFGSRFFSTQEEKAAADFLAAKLSEYGLQNVRVEPFTLFGWKDGELAKLWSWKRGTASLQLSEPVHQRLPCISFANAPSTPKEGVIAEIFNLESGTRAYLAQHREEIKGKLVLDGNYVAPGAWLSERDPVNLYELTIYGYLVKFGALGMIFLNRNYGNLTPTGPARYGSIGEIPAVGISRETSRFILRQMTKSKVVAKLQVSNTYEPGATSYNVIADLPGHTYPHKVILVGGHYDGYDISVGAMDDAAGACVVLETARALSKHGTPLKRTIRFCCFGSEELGLNGSTGYILNHTDEIKNIELMINTDAVGISAKTGHGFEVCGPQELVSYLDQVLNRLGTFDRSWELPKVTQRISAYSDHWPFYMLGVPTAHFCDMPPDPVDLLYSHTTADTVDKVDPKGLKDAALILALTIMQISDEEEVPIKHNAVAEIVRVLEKKGIAENLRVEKRWGREVPTLK